MRGGTGGGMKGRFVRLKAPSAKEWAPAQQYEVGVKRECIYDFRWSSEKGLLNCFRFYLLN